MDKEIEKFVQDITKPLFVYRMNKAQAHRDDAKGKAARTALSKAEMQILLLIKGFGKC